MDVSVDLQAAWASRALEQAKLIVQHLEAESADPDFVAVHALTILQASDEGDACLVRLCGQCLQTPPEDLLTPWAD